MQKLALLTGGRYFSGETVNELSSALNSINVHEQVDQSYQLKTIDECLYDRLLIISASCFVFAWLLSQLILKESFE